MFVLVQVSVFGRGNSKIIKAQILLIAKEVVKTKHQLSGLNHKSKWEVELISKECDHLFTSSNLGM